MSFLALLVSTGLVTGATYGLIAMGFALIYKSTGVVNFAQGELVMLTAYVSFSLANAIGLSFLPASVGDDSDFNGDRPYSRTHRHPPDARRAGLLHRDGDGRTCGDPSRFGSADLGLGAA